MVKIAHFKIFTKKRVPIDFCSVDLSNITKTRLFKYIDNFTSKTESFQIITHIFLISVQNIDSWYSLEPPRRGGSNEYHKFFF